MHAPFSSLSEQHEDYLLNCSEEIGCPELKSNNDAAFFAEHIFHSEPAHAQLQSANRNTNSIENNELLSSVPEEIMRKEKLD